MDSATRDKILDAACDYGYSDGDWDKRLAAANRIVAIVAELESAAEKRGAERERERLAEQAAYRAMFGEP